MRAFLFKKISLVFLDFAKAKFHLVRSYPNGWSYVKYIDSGMPYSGYVATEFVKNLE